MFIGEKHLKAKQERKVVVLAVILLTALLLLPTGTVWAGNPNYRFCFPNVINLPGQTAGGQWTNGQPPTIDGNIAGDNGWTGAWRYAFSNGTLIHDAVVQGVKNTDFLYLSFEVNHDRTADQTDVIVVATDPTGAPEDRKLLEIFPLALGGASITYWQGQNDLFTPWIGGSTTPIPLPTGTEVFSTQTATGSEHTWFVELKLPRTAFGIPQDNAPIKDFGLYLNIIPVNGPLSGPSVGGFDLGPNYGYATEYPWPADDPSLADLYVYDLDTPVLPDPGYWGIASVGTGSCNGVYITPQDIYTDNPSRSMISLSTTTPNVFHAIVHNNLTNAAGAHITAKQINATFKIADFGLGGGGPWEAQWNKVPATSLSTNPTATMDIPGTEADFSMSWTLDLASQATYSSHRHQCMLVELDTDAPSMPWGTTFTTKSAWTNMDFDTASTFESSAKIDPRGWLRAPRGSHGKPAKPVLVDLWVTKQIDTLDRADALQTLEPAFGKSREHRRAKNKNGSWAELSKLDEFPAEQNASWQEYGKKLNNRSTQVSQLTYLVHGCAHTGKKVKIKGAEYEICKSMGSYGYVVRHAGQGEAKWKFDLHGPGVKEVQGQEGHYQVSLDKPLVLGHHFEATDGPRPPFRVVRDWLNDHRAILFAAFAAAVAGIYLSMRRKNN